MQDTTVCSYKMSYWFHSCTGNWDKGQHKLGLGVAIHTFLQENPVWRIMHNRTQKQWVGLSHGHTQS